MKGKFEWLTESLVKLIAPRLVAALLAGLAAGLVAAGLLAPEVGACLAAAGPGL